MQEREQDLEQELSEARQQLAEARAREQDLERRLAEASADNRDLERSLREASATKKKLATCERQPPSGKAPQMSASGRASQMSASGRAWQMCLVGREGCALPLLAVQRQPCPCAREVLQVAQGFAAGSRGTDYVRGV